MNPVAWSCRLGQSCQQCSGPAACRAPCSWSWSSWCPTARCPFPARARVIIARTGKGQASSRHWPNCRCRMGRGGGRSDESDRDHIRARENCMHRLDWLHATCLEPKRISKLFVSDAIVASPSAETRRPPAGARQQPVGQCVRPDHAGHGSMQCLHVEYLRIWKLNKKTNLEKYLLSQKRDLDYIYSRIYNRAIL
jgi:hypothetical protein